MIYQIDFGKGNIVEKEFEDLETAMEYAQNCATYNEANIKICLDGKTVAQLPWIGVSAREGEVVTVDYGSFGFYSEWVY